MKKFGLFFIIFFSFGLNAKSIFKSRSKSKPKYPVSRFPVSKYPMIVDLNLNESFEFRFHRRQRPLKLKVVEIKEERDSVRQAVRWAKLGIEVQGVVHPVYCENYTLGKTIDELDLAIECLGTKGITENFLHDGWSLNKDIRLRLYPDYNDHFDFGEFVYPLEKPMFSGETQLGNEPTFIDGGEDINEKKIYYHYGVDIGGMEGAERVSSTSDGVVVASGKSVFKGYKNIPVIELQDSRVTVLDKRGWYHIYGHLLSINPSIVPGTKIKAGQMIGVLGKEGNSGGWAHLHYDIKSKLASGKWSSINAYPFLWEASQRKFKTRLTAIARPHRLGKVGEEIFLHGWFSKTVLREIKKFEWTFFDEDGDSEKENGVEIKRRFKTPGIHTVILKVEDFKGRVDYDFAKVQIVDPKNLNAKYPTLHASYDLRDQVADFKVRVFNGDAGVLKIYFGDDSEEKVMLDSDMVKDGYLVFHHTYKTPGKYLVRLDYLGKDNWGRTFVELDVVSANNSSLLTMPGGTPYKGKLSSGKNLSESIVRYPNNLSALSPAEFHFASDGMLQMLEGAAKWSQGNKTGPICIGDISKKGGGKLARHVLHQRGLDVDIAYLSSGTGLLGHRKDKFHNRFPEVFICSTGITDNFALEKNVSLMAHLARHYDVKTIWVHKKIFQALNSHQYKIVNEEDKQLVLNLLRKDDAHHDHFHVRLWCPLGAANCVD